MDMNVATQQAKNKLNEEKMPIWKVFLYATIVFFSISALIGITYILFPDMIRSYAEFMGKFVATTSILGLFSLFTMNNLFRREHKNSLVRIAATCAMIMNLIWIIPWLAIVWNAFDNLKAQCTYPSYSYYRYDDDEYYSARDGFDRDLRKYEKCIKPYQDAVEYSWKAIATAGILALFFTLLANFVSFESYSQAIQIMRIITLVCAAILASFFILLIDFELKNISEDTYRMMGVIGIVFLFSLVVTPILVKTQKKKYEIRETMAEEPAAISEAVAVAPAESTIDEAKLRAQIEAELREKIEKEVRAQIEAEMAAGSVGAANEADIEPIEPKQD